MPRPLDRAQGSLGKTMFNVDIGAGQLERMAAEGQFLCPHLVDVFGRATIAGRIDKNACPFDFLQDRIVGKHRLDPVWHGRGEMPQKVTSR